MRFNQLDLNLLVALDVLLEEQNITRAAERLHMTQSATSGVLARLRDYFEDELLVQVGRKMQPTPYAQQLAEPVREVLLKVRASITSKPTLEPTQSKRHFRIIISDYLISVLLSYVIQQISQYASHITFEMIGPGDATNELLLRGEVDLMILPQQYVPEGHPSQMLFEEEYVCVVWNENSVIGAHLTLEKYTEMGHIAVGFGRNRHLSLEEWLMSRYGVSRRIEVITNDFNTVPQLIVGTQRIATMHRRMALLFSDLLPLRLLPPPIKLPVMHEYVCWHRSMDGDPMHRWLREQIFELTQKMNVLSAA
jgi:DNA-binding transcriptional LysR family regulator